VPASVKTMVKRTGRRASPPVGDPEILREKFYSFGLREGDDSTWAEIRGLLPGIAKTYAELRDQQVSVGAVRTELNRLHILLCDVVDAFRALSAPAANSLLGYEPDDATYLTRGHKGHGPETRAPEFDGLFHRVFGSHFEAYQEGVRAALNVAASDLVGAARSPYDPRVQTAMYDKYLGLLEKHEQAEKRQSVTSEISPTTADLLAQDRKVLRELEYVDAYLRRAPALAPPFRPPPPYQIIQGKATELHDLCEIVRQAEQCFNMDWPKKRKGAAGPGSQVLLSVMTSRQYLGRKLVRLIGMFWREEGVERIIPGP
jgi:hypothetical protein